MKRAKKEFAAYLASCTNIQVWECYEKERATNRKGCIYLCLVELGRRGMLP